MAKNDPRGKRSSSKARRRSEEQLDLFPQDLKLAPTRAPLDTARRTLRRDEARRPGAAPETPTRLFLL